MCASCRRRASWTRAPDMPLPRASTDRSITRSLVSLPASPLQRCADDYVSSLPQPGAGSHASQHAAADCGCELPLVPPSRPPGMGPAVAASRCRPRLPQPSPALRPAATRPTCPCRQRSTAGGRCGADARGCDSAAHWRAGPPQHLCFVSPLLALCSVRRSLSLRTAYPRPSPPTARPSCHYPGLLGACSSRPLPLPPAVHACRRPRSPFTCECRPPYQSINQPHPHRCMPCHLL